MFRKKKITIFGGSGFLGSHAADALTDCGHEVTIFDQINENISNNILLFFIFYNLF